MENKLTISELREMKPLDVLDDPRVKGRFVALYENIHGSENGEMFFEQEKYNLQRLIQANPDLAKCTGFSVYGVLLDIANMGLTLENNSRPLLYVLPSNVNVGTKDKQAWEKRATLEISPYGELDLRIQAGQLLYADRPVVVYEGDEFQPRVNESGQKVVVYAAAIPRKSRNIIGAFVKLTRPDNSFDFFWLLPEDIERLKGYSSKKNRGTANQLYSSNGGQIDTGFLEAKLIKHAFKTFPKLKLGQFSKLQDEAQSADYGLDEPVRSQIPVGDEYQHGEETQYEEEAQEEENPRGIKIIENPEEPF